MSFLRFVFLSIVPCSPSDPAPPPAPPGAPWLYEGRRVFVRDDPRPRRILRVYDAKPNFSSLIISVTGREYRNRVFVTRDLRPCEPGPREAIECEHANREPDIWERAVLIAIEREGDAFLKRCELERLPADQGERASTPATADSAAAGRFFPSPFGEVWIDEDAIADDNRDQAREASP